MYVLSCLYSSCSILQVGNIFSPFFSLLFLCHHLLAKGLCYSPLNSSSPIIILKTGLHCFFSLYSSSLIILFATSLCHSSLNSSSLVLLLATGLHHSFCYLTCLFLHLATGLRVSLRFLYRFAFSNMSVPFFSQLIWPCLTLSNRSASFILLLNLSILTLSNRSASFSTVLVLFCF